MLCQLHRYFGKSIKCYLVSKKKNPCSNTGHLLGWAKTKIHMQKRWDTSILGLNEAFWIPGSWVLINYSFPCRNKTGIKEASTHTRHFSLTRTGLPSFQGLSRRQDTRSYGLGTERHFLMSYLEEESVVMLRKESSPSQAELQWFLRQQADNSSRPSNLDNKRALQFYSSDGSHKKCTWE